MRAVLSLSASVSLLVACATPSIPQSPRKLGPEVITVEVPYRTAGAGFGGTANSDIAVVPPGKHAPYLAALCLQRAMAKFNAQLAAPDILALKTDDTDLRWRSDVGPLQADQLASYNAVGTHPALRDRLFGVRFSGRLLIVDNELRFSIEARLSGRGVGEQWRELDEKDYDGSFFSTALASDLKAQLRATRPTP